MKCDKHTCQWSKWMRIEGVRAWEYDADLNRAHKKGMRYFRYCRVLECVRDTFSKVRPAPKKKTKGGK